MAGGNPSYPATNPIFMFDSTRKFREEQVSPLQLTGNTQHRQQELAARQAGSAAEEVGAHERCPGNVRGNQPCARQEPVSVAGAAERKEQRQLS